MTENSKHSSGTASAPLTSGCSDTSCCPPPQAPITRATPKIGRNDPCVCGNGKKYKKCCGKNA
ncbi:SEC-C metal-binding domain-containing protein [Alteromonas sp. C1M14]|uniref:SEC-C metal-binding domain-containing protein n=1 Tax=Alteromonas sp. C1M14 TaxID=2841567 RepID=UPI001C082115|nr:SEC-C domain-containing protein [Alteromonas sp. C1M14]